ncbi:MAG: FG-GAP-like repeat-containing protein, partial [Planctomycetota bacterium]
CPVYDVGEINGQIYIAMAHIQGGTLAEKLQQGRFSDREAASTIARIARAVEAAHRLGIIHRDLKLGNVMLNSQSDPIVMDFGTAREAGRDESITREGALVGTPAYMAPEQLTASKVEIGPVTDVYAMGVMLYELLAGQRPFRGTPLQIIKEADRARPPALEGVDPRLERICLQAMHKNPERRFQTAAELGTALEEFLSKPPKGNSLSRAVGSALCLMFILAVAWQTASFLLKTPQGTIRIVVPMDAEIEIELAKDGNRQRIGKSQNWEIAIEPGAYRLKLISKNKSAEPVFKIQGDKLAVVQRRKTTKIVIKAVRSAERVSPLTPHLLPKQPVVLKESTGRFVDSGQTLGSEYSVYSAAGDVDRDGDVDVVVANSIQGPNRIWLNDGKGNFSVGQEIPYRYCAIVKLGDLDADGDLDLMFGGLTRGAPMTMWVNNGSGTYTESSHSLGEAYCSSFDFGDLDGDGDLDIVGGIRGENRVWLNEGDCIFCEADERLGEFPTNKVALGDLDGDNDLDIFSVNINEPDRVWLNDGHANFTDSEQELGNFNGRDVVLADADRDGDLDAYVVCLGAGNAIWVNDGKARFSPLPFLENDYRPDSIVVADFNGDQVMDRFVGHYSVEKIRLGPGPNLVSISGIPGHWEDTLAGELQTKQAVTADFDGDGDLDLFLANAFHTPNVVWLNEDLPDE